MVGTYDLQQFALAQCAFTINHADLTDNARKAAFGRVHNMYIFTDLPPQPSEWTAKQLKALNRLLRSLLNSAVSWDAFQYIVQHHILTDPWLMSLKQSNQYDQFPLVLATCFNWQYRTAEGNFPNTMEEYFMWRHIPYVTLEEDSSRETSSASLALFLKQWWIRNDRVRSGGPPLSHEANDFDFSRVSDAERAAAREEQRRHRSPREHSPLPPMLDNVLVEAARCKRCVNDGRDECRVPFAKTCCHRCMRRKVNCSLTDQRASEAVDSPRASLAPVLQNNSAPDSLPRARSSSRSPAPSPSHSPSRSVTRSTPASPPNVVSDSSSPLPAGRIASAQSHSPASSASPSTVSVVQMMDVDPVSPGTSSSVDAGAGPSNFGAHRVARRKLNELDTDAIIRDVKRSSDLPMAERLNVHQGVIARLINEVARLRGALQATKKKRARYGGDEDD
ncbi:uncharacterized protein B0H18DRAFT_1129819 [Fomitopsis serialis]|uniref:uncharacterized protein n=1 Tax=Fomitopsis serialis TaxID=139415 RepID=UPI002008A40C|nr:uncharacterized protein B0H18DRAFT_1129819 [Neoantrodia serialis]KAH9910615.1 hypothetical protein B0H18DRAFT_1129819 [Neoantrodia serialis]